MWLLPALESKRTVVHKPSTGYAPDEVLLVENVVDKRVAIRFDLGYTS